MNQLQSKENHPILALTMGDPNGIGAEVMLKALYRLSPIRNWKPLIFGDFRVLEKVRDKLGLDLDLLKKNPETAHEIQQEMETQIPVLDLGEQSSEWHPGTCSRWGGESAFRFLNTAIL